MTRDQIAERVMTTVRKFFEETTGATPPAITETTRLVEDLGGDSLDRLEIAMALEEAFEIEIPDAVTEGVFTVKDAVDAVYERVMAA